MEDTESENSVKITYETLFEILMREKNREDLQKLDDSFVDDVITYLNKKSEFLYKSQQGLDTFIDHGKESILSEIHNIQKIIKEIYDRRERKIIDMARNLAKSPNMLIDTSNCLDYEEELLESIKKDLKEKRESILKNKMLGKRKEEIECKKVIQEDEEEKIQISKTEEPKDLKSEHSSKKDIEGEEEQKQPSNENYKQDYKQEKKEKLEVVFIKDVPEILDSELNNYGPFEQGEEATLPIELIEILKEQESIKIKNI